MGHRSVRQAHMRSVIQYLTYDEPERYGGRDAPAALIHELERRFLSPKRFGSLRGAGLASGGL